MSAMRVLSILKEEGEKEAFLIVLCRAKALLSEAQLTHKITNTKAISCFKRKCARYQEAFKHSKSTGAEQCKRNRSAIYHAYFDSVKNIRHGGL